MRSRIAKSTFVYFGWIVAVSGEVMDAYSLLGLPIEWVTGSVLLIVVVAIASYLGLQKFDGAWVMVLFFGWAAVITLTNSIFGNYWEVMPKRATTSYGPFILLRLLRIVIFGCAVYVTYWLLHRGYEQSMTVFVAMLGLVAAVVAFYMYFAHLYGWPELPRTRVGTTGMRQKTVFDYFGIQRATGTFREPAFLGTWLLLPLFFCLKLRRKVWALGALVIACVIALSGSLTAVISAFVGIVGVLVLRRGYSIKEVAKLVGSVAVVVAGGAAIAQQLAVQLTGGESDLVEVVADRIEPVVEGGGILATNRARTYEYIKTTGVAHPFGKGLGNASIALANEYDRPTVASFYSLYINILYSCGLVGVGLLLWLMFVPMRGFLYRRGRWYEGLKSTALVACYLSYVAAFGGLYQELTVTFGVVMGFMIFSSEIMLGRSRSQTA